MLGLIVPARVVPTYILDLIELLHPMGIKQIRYLDDTPGEVLH
jgi:hypothetical protein